MIIICLRSEIDVITITDVSRTKATLARDQAYRYGQDRMSSRREGCWGGHIDGMYVCVSLCVCVCVAVFGGELHRSRRAVYS